MWGGHQEASGWGKGKGMGAMRRGKARDGCKASDWLTQPRYIPTATDHSLRAKPGNPIMMPGIAAGDH